MMKSAEKFVAGEMFLYDHDPYMVDKDGRCLNMSNGEILDMVDFYDYDLEEVTSDQASDFLSGMP